MSLHTIRAGQGPLLVLLHGWGLNSSVWDAVLPRLNQTFTTLCIDLPGHGASAWPPKFHDIDSLAARVEEALDGDGECSVLGWSLGAMTAVAMASKKPKWLRRLIVVAGTPKFLRSSDWPHAVEPQALAAMAQKLTTDFAGTVRDFLMWQVHGDEHAREALKTLRTKVHAGGEPNPEALSAGLDILATIDLRARLSVIETPTLVISGERDRLSHPDAGQAMAQALPDAQFRLFKRSAHAPFLSHPEAFCAEVEQFMANVR